MITQKATGIKELDGRNVRFFGTGALIILQEKREIRCLRKCRITSGGEKGTTYNRSVLLAIIKALNLLNVACDVVVYTDCIFVKNMAERGNLEKWRRSEWKKAGGGEVKNRDLWQQFTELADRHKITFRFSKHNDYNQKLKELLENGK